MSALVARARGLQARITADARLEPQLSTVAVEQEVRRRIAADYATLARWANRDELSVLELDEDRRSLRAMVRGLAADVPPERRRLAAIPTSRLRERALAALSTASNIGDISATLTAIKHPLRFALERATSVIDVFATEVALAKAYACVARSADRALRVYVTQLIDAENAASAVLLAFRGGDLALADHFIPGGRRLPRELFLTIQRDNVNDVLARAFVGTPLARTFTEDAVLDWQLETQRRLRRTQPHGFAAVVYAVLSRRSEARRLRRGAWRTALGGAR
jgi:vacuolar-type H+-ATPase subunit C/Vma6